MLGVYRVLHETFVQTAGRESVSDIVLVAIVYWFNGNAGNRP